MAVGRIETVVVFLIVATVAGGIGWAVYSTKAENDSARAAGYSDASDMLKAKAAGFNSPDEWRAEVRRLAELDRVAKAQADARDAAAAAKAAADKRVANAAAEKAKTEKDAKTKIDEARFQMGSLYARVLKKNMKNPDSFKLEQVILTAEGMYCFEYRATNSFNAVVPGRAYVGNGKSGTSDSGNGFAAQWNRYCGGKPGDSMSTIVYAINNGWF
jgi:hypothetical protein